MFHPMTPLIALTLCALTLVAAPQARGHGEMDEAELAEFHLHLDDYRDEVSDLAAAIDAVVEAHAAGNGAQARLLALHERWEDVGAHAAIERHASVVYPTIWQRLVDLQRAVGNGRDAAAVGAAAEAAKAALWQGFGALRLAASQVAG